MTLEDKCRELESSLKMYDATIMKMRMGAGTQERIQSVERMRNEVQNELNCINTTLKLTNSLTGFKTIHSEKYVISGGAPYSSVTKETYYIGDDGLYNWMDFEPMLCNRFFAEIAEIPDNRVVKIMANGGKIFVSFRESTNFFVEKYFQDHKSELKDFDIVVKYLNARNDAIITKTYKHCRFLRSFGDELNYEKDSLLEFHAEFEYTEEIIA